MPTEQAIEKAILAHNEWKRHLVRAIQGEEELTPQLSAADDRCEFGKWLYHDASLQSQPLYEKVKKLHADMHLEASRVLALAQMGNRMEAADAMALGSEFARLSSALTLALDKWGFKVRRATLDGLPIVPQ